MKCDEPYALGSGGELHCETVLSIYISCSVVLLLVITITALSVAVCCLAARLKRSDRSSSQQQSEKRDGSEAGDTSARREGGIVVAMTDVASTGTQGNEIPDFDSLYDVITSEHGGSTPGSGHTTSRPPTAAQYEELTLNVPSNKKDKNRKVKATPAVGSGGKQQPSEPIAAAVYSVPHKKLPKRKRGPSPSSQELEEEEDAPPPLPPPLEVVEDDPLTEWGQNEVLYTNTMQLKM